MFYDKIAVCAWKCVSTTKRGTLILQTKKYMHY